MNLQVEYFPPGSKISVEAADDDDSNDGEDCDEKVCRRKSDLFHFHFVFRLSLI